MYTRLKKIVLTALTPPKTNPYINLNPKSKLEHLKPQILILTKVLLY